ncbi:hypothetical protein M2D66_14520, partial [Klebsiella pneumoniae]|nr:hypothetical protein [Klebsiella pneumoniae]
AGKKSAQIREILINESAWEEMTCLFALSLIEVKMPPIMPPMTSGFQRTTSDDSGRKNRCKH